MKTLETCHGFSVASIHQGVLDGVYNWIHTRSEHMTADIFTKPFAQPALWARLKMLINIYSPSQIAKVEFNPDNSWIEPKENWSLNGRKTNLHDVTKVDHSDLIDTSGGFNQQYRAILEGASTADDDWRKPAKQKPLRRKIETEIRKQKSRSQTKIGATPNVGIQTNDNVPFDPGETK